VLFYGYEQTNNPFTAFAGQGGDDLNTTGGQSIVYDFEAVLGAGQDGETSLQNYPMNS
jgi:hypothetical protein